MSTEVYWAGEVGPLDDFKHPIQDEFIDGRTVFGPWGIMTPDSWMRVGVKQPLSPGIGQRYKKQEDGRWLKVEG